MSVTRKVIIVSTTAIFLVPDEPSAIFEDVVFHNGYRFLIILIVLLVFQP